MSIKAFTDEPGLSDAFVRFVYDLYRDDVQWIPPFLKTSYAQLAADFPFYRRPGNHRRHFVAVAGGKTIGRISAMVNGELRDKDSTPLGTVGLFECVEDYAVAQDLFSEATRWLVDTHGIRRLWGPMNFDIWHDYRLMTRGFDQKLFYGEPYNKPYYPDFFERYGFHPRQHWESVEFFEAEALEKTIAWGAPNYERFVSLGYHFEPFNMKRFGHELVQLHGALTRSFAGFLGFTFISFPAFERLFAKIRYAFDPRFFTFIFDDGGRLAGFAGMFLDLGDAARAMKGRDNVLARARFLLHRRRVDRVVFYIVGVMPEEAAKNPGLGSAAVCYLTRQILAAGYHKLVAALMPQEGRSRGLAGGLVPAQRQYTLYEINR